MADKEIKKYLKEYSDFVTKVTSDPSLNSDSLKKRINEIDEANIAAPRLITAALGLGSETGEFTEIVKKLFLQGKPPSEENIFHMKRELGDIMWYWSTACMALNLDPFEVIEENRVKLEARYGEQFAVDRSEHRKEGDL
jgi:NTP pyrophosphatase (non-canonical NTP hydrolase)